ncbi:NUDIX hydrolase [Enemella sp. A6]|uniref:NUDIX hydrolase n=1 Tax=Enemella sp. A6 TaxID=3440152 RepID=UPI003EC04CFD
MPLPDSLSTLAARLAEPVALTGVMAERPPRGGAQASVLALIAEEDAGPDLLFIEKSSLLRKHAGQVAFPGGRAEEHDPDPIHTALREAEEETAVDPSSVEVLGALPAAHVSNSGFDVTCVVGWWREPGPVYPADPGEVAAVHRIRVADLVEPQRRANVLYNPSAWGPAFNLGELFIWGLTAHLLDALLDLAAWSQPWDTKAFVEVPPRFGIGFHPNSRVDEH